jgi:hypothetical protein
MTNNEIVSEITNTLRLNNKDNRLPKRFILKLLQDAATFLISQKWGERSLLQDMNIYTTIPCFEFKKIEVKDCPSIEFRRCDILMKSKKPLPKLLFSKLGGSIRDITSLDGNYRFTFVDETQYRRNKNRKYKIKNEVSLYLGSDNHLYIPDDEIYSLDLSVLTIDRDGAEEASGCGKNNDCKNRWNSDFIISDKLLEATKDMALQKLGMSKGIREDNNPNSAEGI